MHRTRTAGYRVHLLISASQEFRAQDSVSLARSEIGSLRVSRRGAPCTYPTAPGMLALILAPVAGKEINLFLSNPVFLNPGELPGAVKAGAARTGAARVLFGDVLTISL